MVSFVVVVVGLGQYNSPPPWLYAKASISMNKIQSYSNLASYFHGLFFKKWLLEADEKNTFTDLGVIWGNNFGLLNTFHKGDQ